MSRRTVARGRARRLLASAVAVALLASAIGLVAFSVQSTTTPAGPAEGPTDPAAGLESLHAAGVTGNGVSVAVLGVTGFDTDHPALADRVVASRAFGPDGSVRNGGRTAHGTAAASLVARTAPDADLYLASFDSASGMRRALTWAVRRDVDVVVTPVEFYGSPGDGSATVSQAVDAVADDTLVVASAGNLGRGHWQGAFVPDEDGVHQFGGGSRNYLLDGDARRVTLWLSWNERPDAARPGFGLELYRVDGGSPRLVARSQPYEADATPNERIVAEVDPEGTYYVVVRGRPAAAGTHVELSSPTHVLQFRERAGSIVAPATAESALAVGAYDPWVDRVEPFSSTGPTTDGRPGIDVVAPARLRTAGDTDVLVGSSAAAPYTAGVAALVLDAKPSLSPPSAGRLLRETATDVGPAGREPVTGHGLVAPRRAVDAARNATDSNPDLSHE